MNDAGGKGAAIAAGPIDIGWQGRQHIRMLVGGALGPVVGKRAELLGGLVLIGLGCKILVEHQFLGGG